MQNPKAHAINKDITLNSSHVKLQGFSLSQSEKVGETGAKPLEEEKGIEGALPEQAEAKPGKTEQAETEPVGTEPVGTELDETEPVETEQAEAEPVEQVEP